MASRQLLLFDEGDVIRLERRPIPTPQWLEPATAAAPESSAAARHTRRWLIRWRRAKAGRQTGRKG